MSDHDFSAWPAFLSSDKSCCHVYKNRTFKNIPYVVCFKCMHQYTNEKQKHLALQPDVFYLGEEDIEVWRNADNYRLSKHEKELVDSVDLMPRTPRLPAPRTAPIRVPVPIHEKFETDRHSQPKQVYCNGEFKTFAEMQKIQRSLPDVPAPVAPRVVPDPDYNYIVNPKNYYSTLIKAGVIEKPWWLIKVK